MTPEAFTGRLPPVVMTFGKLSWSSGAVVALSEAFFPTKPHDPWGKGKERKRKDSTSKPVDNLSFDLAFLFYTIKNTSGFQHTKECK